VAAMSDVAHLQPEQIAVTQLAVDGKAINKAKSRVFSAIRIRVRTADISLHSTSTDSNWSTAEH